MNFDKQKTADNERYGSRAPYQIQRAGKPSFNSHKLVLATWRITPKRKNVLDAVGFDVVKSVIELLHRHVRAGQMHHSLNTNLFRDTSRQQRPRSQPHFIEPELAVVTTYSNHLQCAG